LSRLFCTTQPFNASGTNKRLENPKGVVFSGLLTARGVSDLRPEVGEKSADQSGCEPALEVRPPQTGLKSTNRPLLFKHTRRPEFPPEFQRDRLTETVCGGEVAKRYPSNIPHYLVGEIQTLLRNCTVGIGSCSLPIFEGPRGFHRLKNAWIESLMRDV
jgi:hypothetical protein